MKDREKNRDYQRKWWNENREVQKARVRANQEVKKVWFKNLKAGLQCELCGENHPATLDFHHLDPSKKSATISMSYMNWSIEHIEEEIAKCQVLCSNCHRKLHYKE